MNAELFERLDRPSRSWIVLLGMFIAGAAGTTWGAATLSKIEQRQRAEFEAIHAEIAAIDEAKEKQKLDGTPDDTDDQATTTEEPPEVTQAADSLPDSSVEPN